MNIKNIFKRPPAPALTPSDAAHLRFTEWLRNYKPNFTNKIPQLTRIYNDKFDNVWYLHADPLSMSEERAAALDDAVRNTEYKMSAEQLKTRQAKHVERYQAIMAAGDDIETIKRLATQGANEANDTIYRMSKMTNEKLYVEFAIVFFVMSDENPLHVNVLTQNKKRDIVMKDDDLRAFFLKTSFQILQASTSGDGRTFLAYLDSKNKESHAKRGRAGIKRRLLREKKRD